MNSKCEVCIEYHRNIAEEPDCDECEQEVLESIEEW